MPPVSKKTMRRVLPAVAVSTFMKDVLAASEQDLPLVLQNFNTWTFPKGDLFQWIDVLNKCDSLLDSVCSRYHLRDNLQQIPFTLPDRKLLISILRFSSFLLDHCANRSLYASGNIINELLGTTDIDVLEEVARIALRLAQRASHQRNGRSHFPISQDRLWKLATSLQHSNQDHSISSVSMTELLGSCRAVQRDWPNMRFTYFPPRSEPLLMSGINDHSSSTTADTLITGSTDGPNLIEISGNIVRSKSLESLLWDTIRTTKLPSEYHFDLMLRLRFCKFVDDETKMQQLVNIRVLALAISAYIVPEPVLQAKLFSVESNIVSQLAKMAHPDSSLSHHVVAACLWALEAIAHHRPRLGDVLSALGASINHGPLMYILRTSLSNMQENTSISSSELVDALMSLLHYLSTTNVAGSMLCSAGLIQMLVNFIGEAHLGALRTLVKALNLLDHLVYGFPQAFNIFCESQGITSLVRRIREETQETRAKVSEAMDIKAANKTDYAMTHERFSLLKTMLKFIVHMMQTSGTADGLRNLIESSLLTSMQEIYEDLSLFGSSIFASTTNILATFIHNEPSSYQILHEARLPELFLRSVAKGVLPAADVMTAIPNAFGAICLNTQGLALFNELSPFAEFMKIFVTEKHCEVLRESDIAGLLGTSIDEFVRHHPSLKVVVDTEISTVLRSITQPDTSSVMFNSNSNAFASTWPDDEPQNTTAATFTDEDEVKRPIVVLHIDIVARFLEGYLQNPKNSQVFVADHGVELLLSFYTLVSLPYDFAKSHAALSLSHVLRLACEAKPQMLIDAIFLKVSRSLAALDFFTIAGTQESFFEPYLSGVVSQSEGSRLVQCLQIIHSLVVLLSDIYASPIVSHARSSGPFYLTFTANDNHAQLLSHLASFHRRIIWEDIKLSNSLAPEWIRATQPKDDAKASVGKNEDSDMLSLTDEQKSSSRFRDLKMVRFFLCQIPPCIVPFFQGLTKMLCSNRRAVDYQHKIDALKVARLISNTLEDHLQWVPTFFINESCHQSYHLMILTLVQMLICDGNAFQVVKTTRLTKFRTKLF
ncbi:E3 ubiquitin-protein ligase ptr1 [Taphrina deformans PYCC 5710]|uniref:E3 ubiquitin-protein ligase ptr1 n=1 Tax=Taphrina deformans (strain PYCC 5710 / ATCC 11124 / CBS 356.35 / IMI 108563 / JCM 9778 / NBRC 8474) TaxID=1097556 RepID=R4X8M7_TAPDE|nr:E3 ubiquitin-protein ligase ptr1 [Taphrina deformans PYCC 5710]|eukprot:CCG81978.1 E3 ubiquitin-protein ligase ptr1 [Taphrina deformans PYCC 5710]